MRVRIATYHTNRSRTMAIFNAVIFIVEYTQKIMFPTFLFSFVFANNFTLSCADIASKIQIIQKLPHIEIGSMPLLRLKS